MTLQRLIAHLEKHAGPVQVFSPYHFRVDGRFDVFPSDRRVSWAWHDLISDTRGHWHCDDLHSKIPAYLKANPKPEPQAIGRPAPNQVDFVSPLHLVLNPDLVPGSFKEKLVGLYANDRPFEELWALIEEEIERVKNHDQSATQVSKAPGV